jgi:hypothetical protein
MQVNNNNMGAQFQQLALILVQGTKQMQAYSLDQITLGDKELEAKF